MANQPVVDDVDDDIDSCLPRRKPKRPRSMRWRAYLSTWTIKMMAKTLKFFLRLDVKVHNKGSIPKKGPVVVVGNHLSFADPPLWGATISRNGAIMAAKELMRWPVVKQLLQSGGHIIVDRDNPEGRKEAFEKADVILSHGGLVGGYPEAGIKRYDPVDNPMPWRTGLFRLARKYEAPIVVVYVEGTDDAWASRKADIDARGGKVFNRKAKLRISYSDPIYYDEYKHLSDVELADFCFRVCHSFIVC